MEDTKDFEKDVEFLEDIFKPDRTVEDTQYYKAGKIDSRKYYKSKGITANTLKSVADATNDMINGSIKFASNKLVNEEDQNIKRIVSSIYTDLGKIQTRVSRRKRKIRNPKTNEVSVKNSSIIVANVVKPLIDKELIKECEKMIEESVTNDDDE